MKELNLEDSMMNREGTQGAKTGTIGHLGDDMERYAHSVLGATVEVHRILGPGYLESVYEEALSIEMRIREIPFEKQLPIAINYKGHPVGEGRLDFLIGKLVVVELKTVDQLAPIHTA